MPRGGVRPGSGRPKGAVKPEGQRKQHQIRAYDDEWELIRLFSQKVKRGGVEKAQKFMEEYYGE